MNAVLSTPEQGRTARYAQVVGISKKSEWQIDRDLLDHQFDFTRSFLPAGLSRVDNSLPVIVPMRGCSARSRCCLCYVFGTGGTFHQRQDVTRARAYRPDQNAMEALVRFTNDEPRTGTLPAWSRDCRPDAAGLPPVANPSADVAARCWRRAWAVLALTCHIELFVQSHYVRASSRTPTCARCSRTSSVPLEG
jgi:hypothetical protein